MPRSTHFDWFVAQYKPNSCFIAKKNLEQQGITTFLPLIETTKIKSNTFLTVLTPLFPGYVFLSFNTEKIKLTTVNSTIGLQRLLISNNIPQTIPESFIHALKHRCDTIGKLLTRNKIEIGNTVEVSKGPFTKMVGLVEKIDTQKRITLLFEIMGQKTKTSISEADLKVLA